MLTPSFSSPDSPTRGAEQHLAPMCSTHEPSAAIYDDLLLDMAKQTQVAILVEVPLIMELFAGTM